MRVSVVINTYNRGKSLRNTLLGLRYQIYRDFEVIVVNGPSTDETSAVLAEFAGMTRVYACPEVHLSKSRNIGIAHAAGEIVAFIDDDAIPESDWLSEIVKAYDTPDVGGVGGIVYDHSGVSYQYQYSLCSRVATTRFDVQPPFELYNRIGSDPFLYLQGTNCSFRRKLLLDIGGFNEEIEYYLDEVEVCMRGIDAGYRIVPLPNAAVHHKYLQSHIRDHKRVVLDPFSTVKNHCTFAVRYGTLTRSFSEVMEEVTKYVSGVKNGGRGNLDAGLMTQEQYEHYIRRTESAMDIGVRQGLTKPRPIKTLPPAPISEFKPYSTLQPTNRMNICLTTREYPPACGGVGRYISDLANGFAAAGHQVHVITHANSGRHTVDFEGGVWMHRVPDVHPRGEQFRSWPLCHNLIHVANVYHEVSRIHETHPLDIVLSPIWLSEGAISQLDDRWPTVLSLQTSMKTIVEMGGTNANPELATGMIALETATTRGTKFLHGISQAILTKVKEDFAPVKPLSEHVVHIGTRDVAANYPRKRPLNARLRILFVGRIETRKGVDLLLKAAYEVLPEFAYAELVLVGKHNPSGNDTATEQHAKYLLDHPELKDRIIFAGEKSDEELLQEYADADIVVLPSRYESFGLVLTEGMMFGKPVVATRVGGMVEIVEHGVNGFLVDPENPASMAQAFRTLLASADTRARFGKQSREIFERKFSSTVMVRNTLACFQEITKQWKANAPKTPADSQVVRDRLKAFLQSVTNAPTEQVDLAARELLSKQFRTGGDAALALQDLWHRPNDEFICGLYEVVLKRPADPAGLQWHMSYLNKYGDRRAMVELLLNCPEARAHNTDTNWFKKFVPPPPARVAVVAPPPVETPKNLKTKIRSAAGRTRTKLLRIPLLGRALRLLKQTVIMPRTVKRLWLQNGEITTSIHTLTTQLTAFQEPALRQIGELQQQLTERLTALEAHAVARDRQVQWMLHQQSQTLDDLVAEKERQQVLPMSRPNKEAA